MPDVDRRLPHRLARNPTVLGELRYWSIIATAWNGVTGLLAYVVVRDGGKTPWWAWLALGIGGLVGVGLVWDILGKAWRGVTARTPVVEISTEPVGRDGLAQLRVVEPNPGSLTGLTVLLVAGATKIDQVYTTTATTMRLSGELRHRATLLELGPEQLAGVGRIDRLVELRFPADAIGQGWSWRVAVLQHVRRGPPREHLFPIRVGDAAPSGLPVADF